jgi:2-polyprenyl-3-methyl-5-hydroxy-6-metoxy-1,4-benzoquinol methylase
MIGDRLSLFKNLVEYGPATSEELADRAEIKERYAREWLGGMASAGYLTYDGETGRFTLPEEHAPVLAQENGPFYFGGAHQMLSSLMGVIDEVTEAFRKGGGVHQSRYDGHMWDGMERFTNGWFENFLTQVWIPAMPEVQRKLERGVRMADFGCGRGRALVKLAEAYPNSSFVGYDAFGPTIERAREHARSAGVSDRVSFEEKDVSKGISEKFDIISTFDVIHDAADPQGLLGTIRRGLKDDGIYVCVDINDSHDLEENLNPLGAFFHGASVLYCMTTSLANGGVGLGTLGFNEKTAREMCAKAGFSKVKRLPLENPFNIVYEIRP